MYNIDELFEAEWNKFSMQKFMSETEKMIAKAFFYKGFRVAREQADKEKAGA